ncbi:hypothetical protein C8Q79DRAFT_1008599 [Trametes meyenii]|nr:hypothetical protein C8Q79DRAFT_1008599 [Trametes meyenii]
MHAKTLLTLLLPILAVSAAPEKRDGGVDLNSIVGSALSLPGAIFSEISAAGYTNIQATGVNLELTTNAQGSTLVELSPITGGPAVTLAPGGKGDVTTFLGNVVTVLPTGGSSGNSGTNGGSNGGSSGGSSGGNNGGSSASGGSSGKNGAVGLAISKPLLTGVSVALSAVGAGAMMLF